MWSQRLHSERAGDLCKVNHPGSYRLGLKVGSWDFIPRSILDTCQYDFWNPLEYMARSKWYFLLKSFTETLRVSNWKESITLKQIPISVKFCRLPNLSYTQVHSLHCFSHYLSERWIWSCHSLEWRPPSASPSLLRINMLPVHPHSQAAQSPILSLFFPACWTLLLFQTCLTS